MSQSQTNQWHHTDQRPPQHNLSKAANSPFVSEMIAKPERKPRNKSKQLRTKHKTSTQNGSNNKQGKKNSRVLFVSLRSLVTKIYTREGSGSVVECLTRDRGAAGSSLTGVTALWSWARHIYHSLVLVQPRKTCPCLTERLLMGHKESNQTNKTNKIYTVLHFFMYL